MSESSFAVIQIEFGAVLKRDALKTYMIFATHTTSHVFHSNKNIIQIIMKLIYFINIILSFLDQIRRVLHL